MEKLIKLNPITLQQQLYDVLNEAIKTGKYAPGWKIPTEFELSEMYQVSRVTVRGAIQQLVNEDKLIRKTGKGTFVKPIIHRETASYGGGSFSENCLKRNVKPSTQIIDCHLIEAKKSILDKLETDEKQIIEIKRVRFVDDDPCITEIDYFPASFRFLMERNIQNTSLLRLVQKETGLIPTHTVDSFSVEYASKEFAQYLNCPIRTPLLLVDQIVTTADNKVIYFNQQYILTSKYIYVNTQ